MLDLGARDRRGRGELGALHPFRETYDPGDATSANDSMPSYVWSALAATLAEERTDTR